jgi:hypothetical protein
MIAEEFSLTAGLMYARDITNLRALFDPARDHPVA